MKQVVPIWVGPFDKFDLPSPFPGFHLFFAADGRGHCGVLFEVYEPDQVVPFAKPFDGAVAMLPGATTKV